MTARDEALRALEKVSAEMRARRVNHGKSESPTLVAWANQIDVALAAILATASEQAPVASSAAEEFEFYVQAEIARAPAPLRELGDFLGDVLDEDRFATANRLLLQLATSYYEWIDGTPPRLLSKEEGEWFIAETTHGDRVVIKGLPEEYSYDFATADGTYYKREFIKRWRQFPDSDYKSLGEPSHAHTSEARDARLTDAQIAAGWRETFSTQNPFCPIDLKSFTKAARWAERAALRQEADDD